MRGPTKEVVEEIVRDWPKTPREVVETVMGKYGPPDEVTQSLLIWRGNGPWKWSLVWREPVPHSFPAPHEDILEQAIDYRVPVEKFTELAIYDGSVICERTKGEISARCEGEELNFLALNLANDICTGKVDAHKARIQYGEIKTAFGRGEKHPYTQGLQFEVPTGDTADPDEQTIEAQG
jgi:hypothetical protein